MNIDRFMSNVSPEPNSGCWLWMGSVVSEAPGAQYGQFGGGRNRLAHRKAYEHFVGPVPEGLVVRHKCDMPCCVNPDHLKIGTHQDNSDDCRSRDRHAYGERAGLAKLTNHDARVILVSEEPGSVMAARYGIATSTVARIRSGEIWSHLRGRRGTKRRRSLNAEQVAKIRASNESAAYLSGLFNVSRSTIYAVRSGQNWK